MLLLVVSVVGSMTKSLFGFEYKTHLMENIEKLLQIKPDLNTFYI